MEFLNFIDKIFHTFTLGCWSVFDNLFHDFIGKAALKNKRAEGPDRELKGLLIEGGPVDPNPAPVGLRNPNGSYAGQTRIVCHSRKYQRNLGLAVVEVPHNLPGTKVQVETSDGWRPAIVADLPFDL